MTTAPAEAHALPAEDAIRVGAAIQHLVAHETGVADTIDPMAGSYFVESLTNELETKAREYMAQIEKMGGSVKAIETGWMQSQISEAAWDCLLYTSPSPRDS